MPIINNSGVVHVVGYYMYNITDIVFSGAE